MAAEAARKLAGYEELLRLPEGERAEVIGGELVRHAAPGFAHGRAQRGLGTMLGGPFDDDDGRGGPGGWWIVVEPDVRLSPHDIVRPDVAGWRRERLPLPWSEGAVDVAPDWVCEVLSPGTALRDRRDKKRLYGTHGVGHYWLLDPAGRLLEAWARQARPEGGFRWVEVGVYGAGERARIAPFEAVELEIDRLFPPEAPASAPEPSGEPGG